ncbi:unnamed protein product [marine sediment metagenome]|uniref:Uncharacterized protein n=1 Tax=marine sediment metagenome TaxID=412755 RepID=X0S0F0_9ZZZZ
MEEKQATPIDEIGMNPRALHPLVRAGYESAEQLAGAIRGMNLMDRRDGLMLGPGGGWVRMFGPGKMVMAMDALRGHGFDLSRRVPQVPPSRADSLERIADALERIADALDRKGGSTDGNKS